LIFTTVNSVYELTSGKRPGMYKVKKIETLSFEGKPSSVPVGTEEVGDEVVIDDMGCLKLLCGSQVILATSPITRM